MAPATRKYNFSRQREVIYRVLSATTSHPTAEWVYRQAREELPTLSLGTVYRNLQILREQGRIRELHTDGTTTRYDAMLEPHHHFVCERCGSMEDVFLSENPELSAVAAEMPGVIEGVRLEFYGRCTSCNA